MKRIFINLSFYIYRYFRLLPIRLIRLIQGIFNYGLFPWSNRIASKNPLVFIGDLLFLILDIVGIAELHELTKSIFFQSRKLSTEELIISTSIFQNTLDYKEVRVNTRMMNIYKKLCHAFVSFNTINYSGRISDSTFIHEMMHVYQYQRFGSLYLFRALMAQSSSNTYDYGGIEKLNKVMIAKGSIFDFNFEQQAEIIEDYFKIKSNEGLYNPLTISIYLYFYNQILN